MSTGIDELTLPGAVCLPGQPVLSLQGGATVIVGRGLRLQPGGVSTSATEVIVATMCGTLRRSAQSFEGKAAVKYDVVSPTAKAYAPRRGDAVIGTIVKAQGLQYMVHVGGPHPAVLDALAFDGATKTNRPKMEAGDVVYCRVTAADRDVDPEVTCCATAEMTAKDWVTGEAVYGPLKAGAVLSVPLQYASELLQNQSAVMLKLGAKVPFEAVIGANGRVWVNAPKNRPDALVALAQCIQEARLDTTPEEVEARVEKFFPSAGKGAAEVEVTEDGSAQVSVMQTGTLGHASEAL